MFEIGSYIVKPGTGVCRIDNIVRLDVSAADKNKLYYLLTPVDSKGVKVYLPTGTTDVHVRKIMTHSEALSLIQQVRDIDAAWIGNEKERERKYKEAIRSCNPKYLISIIKTMYLRQQKRLAEGKKWTSIDERYYKLAESQLYSELCIALQKSQAEILQMIETAVHTA